MDIVEMICIAAAVIGICYGLYSRIRVRHLTVSMGRMLDMAIDGTFTEHKFDESLLSALESKLWKYLTTAEISAENVAHEKDKIKQLVADIAHQTKTPVSNIILYSELLQEQELGGEAPLYVRSINMQAAKLGFLITSLVKLSRLETGILTLHPKPEQIMPMLASVFAQTSSEAWEKGLSFELQETTAEAVFDRKWTEEAVCNLVDNAIKYTETGGITLQVRQYEMFVCIEIADTGIGIHEEEMEKIFARFYRSGEVCDREGVGIGLYLAREIIIGQNGYIKVTSQPGEGSVFSVYLLSVR